MSYSANEIKAKYGKSPKVHQIGKTIEKLWSSGEPTLQTFTEWNEKMIASVAGFDILMDMLTIRRLTLDRLSQCA